jgi:hypothetical protein
MESIANAGHVISAINRYKTKKYFVLGHSKNKTCDNTGLRYNECHFHAVLTYQYKWKQEQRIPARFNDRYSNIKTASPI